MKQKTTNNTTDSSSTGGVGFVGWSVRNVLLAAVTVGTLMFGYSMNESYDWMKHSYIETNLQTLSEHSKASLEERYAMALGADYSYMMYVKKNTPVDAVILVPPQSAYESMRNDPQFPMTGVLAAKMKALRFLYPRKVVTENEYMKTPYGKRVGYIAIVGGWGKDKLSYKAPDDLQLGLLPVDSVLITNHE